MGYELDGDVAKYVKKTWIGMSKNNKLDAQHGLSVV
jgi:hypothetical protein